MMKVYYILLLTLVGMALSTKGNEVDTDLEMEEQGRNLTFLLGRNLSVDEERKVKKCGTRGKKCKTGEECVKGHQRIYFCRKI